MKADPFDVLNRALKDASVRARQQGTVEEVVLSGAAGTGKTTMTERVIDSWGSDAVTLLAPTGKAARRMTEATGHPAGTMHASLYGAPEEDKETGELRWPEPNPLGGADQLVIIDEASMVGKELADDLRAAAAPGTVLLFVGDPYQLPPVNDAPGVDLMNPTVRLMQVHRSADGIMRFAYDILRTTTGPELSQVIQTCGRYPNVHIPSGVTPEAWRAATFNGNTDSVLITYRNANRHGLNALTRRSAGLGEDRIYSNEPLVVMTTNKQMGVANGELCRMGRTLDESDDPDRPLHLNQIEVETGDGRKVRAYTTASGFGEDTRAWREARREDTSAWRYRMAIKGELKNPKWIAQAARVESGELPRTIIPGPAGESVHLHFGYCLTCHKMQGSEAENVGIVWAGLDSSGSSWSDWWCLRREVETARAWWYTAVTRAKRAVIVWK